MKLTLDWNCVIEIEESRPQSAHVWDLINRHREGEFEVALLAASASENSRSKRFPGNASSFVQRVSMLGLQDLPLVPMPGVWGLSYLDFCYFVDDAEKFQQDIDALWQAMAPKIPRDLSDHLPLGMDLNDDLITSEHLSKWRNTWCDVISAYSHIHGKRDLFVTNNTRDFQDNADKLSALGMRQIATPMDALATVAALRSEGL